MHNAYVVQVSFDDADTHWAARKSCEASREAQIRPGDCAFGNMTYALTLSFFKKKTIPILRRALLDAWLFSRNSKPQSKTVLVSIFSRGPEKLLAVCGFNSLVALFLLGGYPCLPTSPWKHCYPTPRETRDPSLTPSSTPSLEPSARPSSIQSIEPSTMPSRGPPDAPSRVPSDTPLVGASSRPSEEPSAEPSVPHHAICPLSDKP